MPSLTFDADALAHHRARLGQTTLRFRPVRYRLDSDGSGRAVELPGPAWLAPMLSLGVSASHRDGSRLVVDGETVPLEALAADLHAALAALPERADASEAYADVRLAATTPSPRFSAWLVDVARAYRRTLPALPREPKAPRPPRAKAPAPVAPKPPRAPRVADPRPPAEIERARRAEERALMVDTASLVLRRWCERGALTPGRYQATELLEKARSAIARSIEAGIALPDGSPLAPRLGARTFYAVADAFLGERTRTKLGYVYDVGDEAVKVDA